MGILNGEDQLCLKFFEFVIFHFKAKTGSKIFKKNIVYYNDSQFVNSLCLGAVFDETYNFSNIHGGYLKWLLFTDD